MRKIIFLLFAGLLFWAIGCQKDTLFEPMNLDKVLTLNATEGEIQEAINDGVAWLITPPQYDEATGIFGGNGDPERVARTALAVTKLCDYSRENKESIYEDDGEYYDEIINGLNFLFSEVSDHSPGFIINAGGPNHDVYNTGLAAMAIAAYRCPTCDASTPVGTMTHLALMEGIVAYFDDIQYPAYLSNPGGGWRYSDPPLIPEHPWEVADNSNSGFATLGLLAAQEFGVVIPEGLKDELSPWLDYIQNDGDGGSGYTAPGDWVNIMKTGNLLYEFSLIGDDMSSTRALNARAYIEAHWNDPNTDPGFRPDNYLAMFCLMKGFVSMGIDMVGPYDWYAEISEIIVSAQDPGGFWPSSPWMDSYLSTVFNLLTLEKIAPSAILEVFVDMKPGSCPNPINMKAKGLVPFAILGTADFDVTEIDPETIVVEGIPIVKSSFNDIATPFDPGPEGLQDQYDCTTEGADGYQDLIFHIENEALAAWLEANGYEKGDTVCLNVEGELINGLFFHGQDIGWIKN